MTLCHRLKLKNKNIVNNKRSFLFTPFVLLFTLLLLTACNDTQKSKPALIAQASAIEIVIYKTKAGVNEASHIRKANAITPILSHFNGFVLRQFSQTTDGKWVDIVYWKDLRSAEAAATAVKNIPACQLFFANIDLQTMEFMHSIIRKEK